MQALFFITIFVFAKLLEVGYTNNELSDLSTSALKALLTTWARYDGAGFSPAEYMALKADEVLFAQVDGFLGNIPKSGDSKAIREIIAYLNENNFDESSKQYAINIATLLNENKKLESPGSGFCSKSDLYDFVKSSSTLCSGCDEGQLQDKIGTLFENAYNSWQEASPLAGYTPNPENGPNSFKAWSTSRGKFVVPDGFFNSVQTTSGLGLPASEKAHWAECKASNKNLISLGDYEGQIKGEIDALAEYQPWACNNKIAGVTYITTIDLVTSPKVVKYANDKGIWIFNSYAYFKIENNKMYLTFTPPFPFGLQFGQPNNIPDIPSLKRLLITTYVELK